MKLWHQNILAILIGTITGAIFGNRIVELKAFGDLFISIAKMLAIPLIFFSIINSFSK